VTIAVAAWYWRTLRGANANEARVGALVTDTTTKLEDTPSLAVTVTGVRAPTADGRTVKDAELAKSGTVTVVGTGNTDPLELVKLIVRAGRAGSFRFTRKVTACDPPTTLDGLAVTLPIAIGARIESQSEIVFDWYVVEIVADAPLRTGVIETDALSDPAGMRSEVGTVATVGSELVRVTVTPPVGA
jgi:hypothetical protein